MEYLAQQPSSASLSSLNHIDTPLYAKMSCADRVIPLCKHAPHKLAEGIAQTYGLTAVTANTPRGPFENTSRAPISRVTKACNACRSRKVRCDAGGLVAVPLESGERPCSRCKAAEIMCVYPAHHRKRGPKPGTKQGNDRLSGGRFSDRPEQDPAMARRHSASAKPRIVQLEDDGRMSRTDHRPATYPSILGPCHRRSSVADSGLSSGHPETHPGLLETAGHPSIPEWRSPIWPGDYSSSSLLTGIPTPCDMTLNELGLPTPYPMVLPLGSPVVATRRAQSSVVAGWRELPSAFNLQFPSSSAKARRISLTTVSPWRTEAEGKAFQHRNMALAKLHE
jgi:hypothetical protein